MNQPFRVHIGTSSTRPELPVLAGKPVTIAAVLIVALAFAVDLWAQDQSAKKPASTPAVDKDHAEKFAAGLAIFKKHVRPILVRHCVQCHGGETVEAEFDLTERDRLLKGAASGKVFEAGKARSGRLFAAILHTGKVKMPYQQNKLADEDIAHIAQWLDLGAPYDGPLVEGDAKPESWTRRVIAPEAKDFWSFQPLRRAEPPAVKNAAWCRTPVDRFVLARLEAAGLQPGEVVDRNKLIRRAYFDLLGLPPSPEEVHAFLNDQSNDAWGNLIDRLLASPHYGERWARHWLDIARFAESHGFEHDTDRPTAYHYRDFVIQALNQDLPYDTFVRWQIAGDEFAPENHLAMMATGFLAAGVHSTQITKNEVEKHRYDELDDMLATIGSSMLGLSIGCARCHDHKFDPIPQCDYYRLLSTFTTTVRSELYLNLDPAGYQRAKGAFDAEHAPFAAAVRKFEAEQLPGRFAAWEKNAAAELEKLPWIILDPQKMKSSGGATLTKQPDGSILVTGKNPDFDTYTFDVPIELSGITGVRLEALSDPSMKNNGPGRADNGNFDLTDFKLTLAPNPPANGERQSPGSSPDKSSLPVKLTNPRATFEQSGLPIAAAIDDNAKSGWAVDPQFGKDHAAAFDVEMPAAVDGGVLTFTLAFNGNNKHNIGRIRLSVTRTSEPPDVQASGIPQAVVACLQTPAEKRTADQTAIVLKWYAPFDAAWQELHAAERKHAKEEPQPPVVKALISSEGVPPLRLNTQGADFLEQTHFLRRGDPQLKDAVASPGFLQVLMPAADAESRWQMTPPSGCRTSYRRASLANWLTDTDDGAGRLLARVIVNRLWQHHFGRGIVATPNDFGIRGARPSHPELLDWLATELVARRWKLKDVHKLIMTSAVYMQSSRYDETKAAVDRENELFWRRPPHRLEAEVIRDALLAAGGLLDTTMYGPGTLDEGTKRRSIYFTVKRSKLISMMTVFDAPDALSSIGERSATTVAPQALMLLNNPLVQQSARAFAERIAGADAGSAEAAVRAGYLIAVAREPTPEELTDDLAFISAQTGSYNATGRPDARKLAWADFCQVLLCLNEFVYVE
jgi:mono/diheme cytochrome c family protein